MEGAVGSNATITVGLSPHSTGMGQMIGLGPLAPGNQSFVWLSCSLSCLLGKSMRASSQLPLSEEAQKMTFKASRMSKTCGQTRADGVGIPAVALETCQVALSRLQAGVKAQKGRSLIQHRKHGYRLEQGDRPPRGSWGYFKPVFPRDTWDPSL